MAGSNSNIHEVIAWLEEWLDHFDFARPGREQSLGRDIALTIIRGPDAGSQGGILGRCAAGTGPDGSPWPENSPTYRERKDEQYGWSEPNRRTGQMLSQVSLYGRTRVESRQVTLVYGTGNPSASSAAPSGYMAPADRAAADTKKASLAHSGQSRKRVQRPFYEATREDAEAVSQVAQEHYLNDYIRETNGNGRH